MKLLRAVTALSTLSCATSFRFNGVSRLPTRYVNNVTTRTISTTSLNLFNLFSSPPENKIVYSNLPYPGDEMGVAALAGEVPSTSSKDPNLKIATFAGGCFWGFELAYQRHPGVLHTAVGYCGGSILEPTYGPVCSGSTGHTEAVQVYYNSDECDYNTLLDLFFERVDPTTVNGQGNDRGTQYRTGVYCHTDEQLESAKTRFKIEAENFKRPVASECMKADVFWPAEKYHQQYLEKGGRMGAPQSAEKGSKDTIRCYG